MAGEFTVKVLPSEEFDKLPFKRIQNNPSSVYGAADKKSRIAYVRDTGFNDFTKANIGHELDELMAETSPHEEDGIRYKDFSQSFGNFGSSIPVIGKALGPVLKGVGGLGDLAGAGLGKIGLPNFNIGSPSPSASPNIFSAPSIGGTDQGGRAVEGVGGYKLPGFGTGRGASTGTVGAMNTPSFPSFGGGSSSGGNIFSKALGGIGNLFKGIGGGGSGGGSPYDFVSGGGTGGGGPTDIFGQIGKAAPGAAVALLGNLFAPKVNAPDFSGVKSDLASKMGANGGSPAFDLGFGEAKRQLSGETGQIPEAELAAIDLRRDEEIAALEDRFRMAGGGGGMAESDRSRMGTLRTEIVDKYEQDKQRLEFAYKQQQEANRIQVMSEVLRLDQAQFEQYTQLANLDVAQLIEQYGVDVQTATDFKTLFGNIGGQMIAGQFPTRV